MANEWLHAEAEVTCRRHGRMQRDLADDSYVCEGFDGEGCERRLLDGELYLIGLLHELQRRGLLDVVIEGETSRIEHDENQFDTDGQGRR